MGKILIIRGASYTPPSGSGTGTPVIPDPGDTGGSDTPVTPDPPASTEIYQVFYSTDNQNWTLQRPSSGIKSIGLVVIDRYEADLDAISYEPTDDLGTAYYCNNYVENMAVTDGTLQANGQSFGDMGNLPSGRLDISSACKTFMVWIFSNNAMSSSQVDKRLNAAKNNITWITG